MAFIVNMACGLANRMFQYSYYLFLKKYGYQVTIDYYHATKLPHEKVAWNAVFPKAPIKQASALRVFLLGGGPDILSKIRRRYMSATTDVMVMPTAFDAYLPKKKGKDKYVIGVFQNAKMVESVEQEVRRSFVFLPFTDERNRQLEREIKECESVAIHVRKGMDYQQRIWYRDTCASDYYLKAIDWIKHWTNNPVFYVFTDNSAWVKENFTDFDYTLVDWNPGFGWGSHFDMQLMSLCCHNIISNSTYSWWSAFLNTSKDKHVILPKIWFNPNSCDDFTSDKLMCKGWIQL